MSHPTRRRFLSTAAAATVTAFVAPRVRLLGEEAAESIHGAAAGFLDLQVNGYAGVDFNDPTTTPDGVRRALSAMRIHGVTACLPTIISSSVEHFARCVSVVLEADSPAVLGIHMEGPFISPEDGPRGAHRREDTAEATIDGFRRRQDAARGRIRIVTVAPEVPGALRVIEYVAGQGVRVAIGHTAASAEQIREAVRAGATLSTHLGNGAAQMLPRHPNFLWEQLAADELTASLIVDGHHLPPATVKTMVRAKTPARTVLVTDAIAAAGQPPGDYRLGAVTVRVDANGRAAIPGASNLAGSVLSMDRAVANVVRFAGVPLEDALAMAGAHPARYLGVKPRGTIRYAWTGDTGTLRIESVED